MGKAQARLRKALAKVAAAIVREVFGIPLTGWTADVRP
jgi:hypothetical protein